MKELEKRLSKTLATQVRQELMKARAMENVRPAASAAASLPPGCPLAASESMYQGVEFQKARPPTNMNDYIRKDSIPCWNCTLPA